jgi:ABC-2 type transport system permease protein
MKVLAIAGANLRRFVRDRSNLFFVFVLPIGIVLLIGAQFSGGFDPRIGVTGGDGPFGRDLVSRLEQEEDLVIRPYPTEEELLLAVERGAVEAGVVIPAGRELGLEDAAPVEIGFVSRPDGFGPQMQSVLAQAISDLTLEISAARFAVSKGAAPDAASAVVANAVASIPAIEVTTVTAGEALFEGGTGFGVGASSQLVLFMFLTGLTGSAALIQSRQLGVTRRMVGSPTSVGTIIMGEALGRFGVVLIQGAYIVAATILLFRVDWGSPLGVAAVLIVFSAVGAGAAMLFGTLFRNDQQAGGVGVVAGIGLAALGGSMLPLEFFPPAMEVVSRFVPHSWANEALADLTRRGAGLVDILPNLGAMAGFALLFLALAAWRMRQVVMR